MKLALNIVSKHAVFTKITIFYQIKKQLNYLGTYAASSEAKSLSETSLESKVM